ncbi:MAG: protein-L-isoaspartate O-methyltransferase [Parcubacteria group bacterium]|nr:protein-L-isoaspartate O-methyltransferase [Parcubacteria group bacterium]
MEHLILQLKERNILTDPRIESALREIDRARFVPKEKRLEAYQNYPLPIGYGQTISQPETVVFMLELLKAQRGDTVIDVGSGSGWQSALLGHIVGEEGCVHGMEIVSELAEMSKEVIDSYGFITEGRVAIHEKSAREGLPEYASFNRIICAAELPEDIPTAWITQLAPEGKIVAPIGENIVLLIKHESGELERHEYPGYIFVPFVE